MFDVEYKLLSTESGTFVQVTDLTLIWIALRTNWGFVKSRVQWTTIATSSIISQHKSNGSLKENDRYLHY